MEKYTNMLISKMTPVLVKIFEDMFEEALRLGRGHRDNTDKTFKVLCEETINWNNTIIAEHTKEFESRCPYFSDLLAAVFICYINVMARAIKKESHTAQLKIQLPNNSDFIHACIKNMAELIKDHAQLVRAKVKGDNAQLREASLKLSSIASDAIHKTLDDLLPVQDILRTYLGNTKTFEMGEAVSDLPCESESDLEEAPPEEAPTEETPMAPAPTGTVSPFSASVSMQPENELKNVHVSGDEEDLVPHAPLHKNPSPQ